MADRSTRSLKENQPPSDSQNGKKQVDADSPQHEGGDFPVKNTFIHFGTPSRTPVGNRHLATPKTVPPHFAPEVSSMSSSDAPIAPLRLFDFLPSPQVANKGMAPAAMPPSQAAASTSISASQAETITAMAAFHAVHAIFSAMPSSAMPPLPQLGGYQGQPQQYMWPAETSQPDMPGPLPEMAMDGSGGFEDWSGWNWSQGENDGYMGMAQQDSWDLERYDEV